MNVEIGRTVRKLEALINDISKKEHISPMIQLEKTNHGSNPRKICHKDDIMMDE